MRNEYTLRIAPDGVDARAANARDLLVAADHPSLKIQSRQVPPHFDTIPYTFDSEPGEGNTDLVLVPHTYRHKPITFCLFSTDGEEYFIMPAIFEQGEDILKQYRCNSDESNLYIFLRREGAGDSLLGQTVYFKYSLYADAPDS